MKIVRLLVVALLALLPALVQAQTPPAFQTCAFKSIWTPWGTGTDWKQGITQTGTIRVAWWTWGCPQPDGTWKAERLMCILDSACLDVSVVSKSLDTAARSADKIQALKSIVAFHTTPVLPAEVPAWNAAKVEADAAIAPLLLAASSASWVTTGGYINTLTAGKLQLQFPPKKAVVGLACNCTTKFAQNGVTYCPWAGSQATEVTSCKGP